MTETEIESTVATPRVSSVGIALEDGGDDSVKRAWGDDGFRLRKVGVDHP